jgi:hypothetical protein
MLRIVRNSNSFTQVVIYDERSISAKFIVPISE